MEITDKEVNILRQYATSAQNFPFMKVWDKVCDEVLAFPRLRSFKYVTTMELLVMERQLGTIWAFRFLFLKRHNKLNL